MHTWTKLRTFALIVSAHPSAQAKSHATSCMSTRAKKWNEQMIGQMAIAIAFPGFNDLGRTVTRFSFDGSFALLIFCLKRKNEEKLLTRSLNFLQNAWSNALLLALCSSVPRFQMLFEGLSFVKLLVKFGIVYTNPLLQNKTEINCLRWLTFDILNYKPCVDHAELRLPIYQIRVVFHTLFIWNQDSDPQFFCIFCTSNSLSDCGKNLKKYIVWKIFAQTSLNDLALHEFS